MLRIQRDKAWVLSNMLDCHLFFNVIFRKLIFLLVSVLLSSCSSIRLYDTVKDKQAATGVALLGQADLKKTGSFWEDSLDRYVTREIATIDRITAFLGKNMLWRLSSGNVSLAELYLEAEQRLKNLGFAKVADVAKYINLNIAQEELETQLEKYRNNIEIFAPQLASDLPDCAEGVVADWHVLKKLTDLEFKKSAEILYQAYYSYCEQILEGDKAFRELGGEIAAVRDQRLELEQEIRADKRTLVWKKMAIEKAKQALAEAVNTEKKKQKEIAKYSNKLASLLEKGEDKYQLAPDEVIQSITSLLGGLQTDAETKVDALDQNTYVAAAVAKTTPALADSMGAYIENGDPPNFPDLVLELNRQLLLRDYNESRQDLMEDQLSLAREREQFLLKQANADYKIATELCLFSFTQDKKKACKTDFTIQRAKPSGDIQCGIARYEADCPLKVLFAEAWKTTRGEGKRHLLKVLAALSDSNFYSGEFTKNEFRRNDLASREEMLASENAVLQWSNLLRIPTQELASFYAAGIKPEELSDLLVKVVTIAGLAVVAGQK